jgi:hypothetical protein
MPSELLVKPRGIPCPNIFLSFGGAGFFFDVSFTLPLTWQNDPIDIFIKRVRRRRFFFIMNN